MENPVNISLLKSHSHFDEISVYWFLLGSVSLSLSFSTSGCLPLSPFVLQRNILVSRPSTSLHRTSQSETLDSKGSQLWEL